MFDLLDIDPKLVFVLMPFSSDFDNVYKVAIVPAVKKCKLTPRRADEMRAELDILKSIYGGLAQARVVIADMTGRNANVFYELGIAHALGKDIILLTRNRKSVPFDLLGMRNIEYNKNALEPLITELVAHLRSLTQRDGQYNTQVGGPDGSYRYR